MAENLSTKLLNNSLASILSAIEIYNKPDFKYRNEVFTILIINSWELLLKAKILKDNDDNLNSLFVYQAGKPKISRTGNNLTIDIIKAMNILKLNQSISENIKILIEIRDSAIHFYADRDAVRVVYTLGAANIQNYQKLVKHWFNKSLLDYNFYILPLGFSYPFTTISLLDLGKKPEAIKNMLKLVDETKSKVNEKDGFFFTCEIPVKVISAKKIIEDPDITVAIDKNAKTYSIILQKKNLVDLYPHTYKEMYYILKGKFPKMKQNEFHKITKKIRGDLKYSAYNFSSKKKEERFKEKKILPSGTPTIYSNNALRFIEEELKRQALREGR